MSKVTVVGAGAVGATCADVCARNELANEVVLLDIKEGFAEGKALDLFQCASISGFDTRLTGSTNDYTKTADSDVVVITSGIPRKPGMTREELVGTNSDIVKSVVENILKHSPDAILIIVSNPLDTMTYHALKQSGLPAHRVVGMGGALDTARWKAFLALETGCSPKDLVGFVVGGHGDTTMVPLPRFTHLNGIPITDLIPAERFPALIERTMKGGAELTKLIGTSAWYAPGAGAAKMVEIILRDQKRVVPSCAFLTGQYGLNDICLGTPVTLGRKGVEQVHELKLNDEELKLVHAAADAVRNMNQILYPAA